LEYGVISVSYDELGEWFALKQTNYYDVFKRLVKRGLIKKLSANSYAVEKYKGA